MGGRTRLVGLTVGVVCGAMFLAGTSLLSYLPKFLLGGLIAFVGFDFLLDWLYGTWRKLKRFEYMIVVLIFGVSISVGFLEGVAVGILASSVLFILEYSRVRVVKHALSGQHFHSNVDRADPQLAPTAAGLPRRRWTSSTRPTATRGCGALRRRWLRAGARAGSPARPRPPPPPR